LPPCSTYPSKEKRRAVPALQILGITTLPRGSSAGEDVDPYNTVFGLQFSVKKNKKNRLLDRDSCKKSWGRELVILSKAKNLVFSKA
jgi:hypothetical protein